MKNFRKKIKAMFKADPSDMIFIIVSYACMLGISIAFAVFFVTKIPEARIADAETLTALKVHLCEEMPELAGADPEDIEVVKQPMYQIMYEGKTIYIDDAGLQTQVEQVLNNKQAEVLSSACFVLGLLLCVGMGLFDKIELAHRFKMVENRTFEYVVIYDYDLDDKVFFDS